MATGAASNSGQGVATTSTATARTGDPLASHAPPATNSVNGKNHAAYRSASRTTGAFCAPACAASCTMWAYVLSVAVAVACISNALPALTTPLRTGSPTPRSTCSGSPVRTDSSSTAAASAMRPSTGTTSPGPTTSRSSTTTSSSAITLTADPTRRRANRGACSSSALKSWDARRSAVASSARPPASITAINAPARYSPTSSVPISDNTAIRSTPTRPRRRAASTHTTAGATATTVPAIQQPSATRCQPASHAIPPAASAPTVTATRTGSTNRCNQARNPRAAGSEPPMSFPSHSAFASRPRLRCPTTEPHYPQNKVLGPLGPIDTELRTQVTRKGRRVLVNMVT